MHPHTDLREDNPFARPSPLPCALPPFDQITEQHCRAAFLAGMAAQRAQFEAIAAAPAGFERTIVALERSGALLERVSSVFFNLVQSAGSDWMLRLESEIAPLLAAHRDALYLHPELYARVAAVYGERERLDLDGESRQLLERYHVSFVRAGAPLPDVSKTRLRAINQELSQLRTEFRQRVLHATRAAAVQIEDAGQLAGLSDAQRGAAAEAARERGLAGWLIALQNTTTQPPLSELRDRTLRRRIHAASVGRCLGGAHDTTVLIVRVARLRAERAQLLGYPHHAAYVLADENAANPEAVDAMLRQVAGAALHSAQIQAADLQRLIDAQERSAGRPPFTLEAWDWAYYSEQERRRRFAFDAAEVRGYFELERVVHEGLFHIAQRLYGLTFRRCTDLPVYHPDVHIYEVHDAGGELRGLFLSDYYARDGKQGGAWMSNFVNQSQLLAQRPVVVNCLNIPRPAPGAPTLLTFEEVTTLFHEFGHALHGLLSQVRYPLLSGTSVPRDFVEYPSQFHEMWARDPEVVARFARQHLTGEPLHDALLRQILAASNFDQGQRTCEYLQAAGIDQAWHRLDPGQIPAADQLESFEAQVVAHQRLQCPAIPPRYHSPYFLHVFAEDYSAGYYAYLWSEVLARDTGRWFEAHGGLSRANGERLREGILSRGWTADTRQLFQRFHGRAPQIAPLLEYRGLAVSPGP